LGFRFGLAHGKPKGKTTSNDFASIVKVLSLHTTQVRLDDAAAQVQANAHALSLGGVKRFEQAL
jgi:hypothetical protein